MNTEQILQDILSLQVHPGYQYFTQYLNQQIESKKEGILQRNEEMNEVRYTGYDVMRGELEYLQELSRVIKNLQEQYTPQQQTRDDV